MIDECHHLNDKGGMYASVLERTLAPMRIGVTATLPSTDKGRLILEGYLGPVIGEFRIEDAIEKGILARPMIDLIAVPWSDRIGMILGYRKIYRAAIVENRVRNGLVCQEANFDISEGRSVLIIVKEIDHGKILQEMLYDLFRIDLPFVFGKTKAESRNKTKSMLQDKKELGAIANVVWREGTNIPSLNTIVNAGGGKSEIMTAQTLGRGMRTYEDKTMIRLVEFLDPYEYLSHHTVMRLLVYAQNGWLRRYGGNLK
jgi:superfamily II DNA or RNA helicase